MAATRVMLRELPAMLRGILEHTFRAQNDMMLVGTDSNEGSLSAQVAESRPDVLIVGVERPELANAYIELFVDHVDLHILAIGGDARSATMQELFVRRLRVADLSPDAIIAAVRASREDESASATTASRAAP